MEENEMLKPNMYYDQLKESYLFYNIAQKTKKYLELHPEQTLLRTVSYTHLKE